MRHTWKRTWSAWSRATRLTAIGIVFGLFLGSIQLIQITDVSLDWIQQKIYGPRPLDLPLRQIHAGMMEELEFNIDCLESYRVFTVDESSDATCKPRHRYLDTWFSEIAAVSSRDYYSKSENTEQDWKLVKSYYEAISKIEDTNSFARFELKSELTLRDALFLTGYIRYFYKNFYEKPLPDRCQVFPKPPPNCKGEFERLFGDLPAWNQEIQRWDDLPAKRIAVFGKPPEDYATWLGYND